MPLKLIRKVEFNGLGNSLRRSVSWEIYRLREAVTDNSSTCNPPEVGVKLGEISPFYPWSKSMIRPIILGSTLVCLSLILTACGAHVSVSAPPVSAGLSVRAPIYSPAPVYGPSYRQTTTTRSISY